MFEIPADRLPPGFLETVGDPPAEPVKPRLAATIVLLRNGGDGPEVLLMRRQRTSGFVPGAWVFPGGRVDPADSGPALYERLEGLPSKPVPDSPFWVAALRELFEETGVLLARTGDGEWARDAGSDPRLARFRRRLMDGATGMMDLLEEMDLRLDASDVVHLAHWVTPVAEPRRYDTHFFAARAPEDRAVRTDAREMTEAAWLAPARALERFERGELPMVFPTVRTLEALKGHDDVEHVLAAFRDRPVPRILPRLVRTESGVAIVVDEPGGNEDRNP